MPRLNIEERLKIAIKTNNFKTNKRDGKFYKAIAMHFKDITGWFEGCHIHHKDFDYCNNHPSNLECITQFEHNLIHHCKSKQRQIGIIKHRLKMLTG